MNMSEAEAFLKTFHETRKQNSAALTGAFFADDAIFTIVGEEIGTSIALISDNKSQFEGVLEDLLSTWHWIDVDFKSIVADGDVIACRYVVTVKHVPSNTTLKTEIADFITLRDGKIADMREFIDTAYIGAIAAGKAS